VRRLWHDAWSTSAAVWSTPFGSLQRLDDGLLLLAPSNVGLSSQAAAGYLAKGFFNQN
jgi:hypothetical protein